jgi:hypothetical protein
VANGCETGRRIVASKNITTSSPQLQTKLKISAIITDLVVDIVELL